MVAIAQLANSFPSSARFASISAAGSRHLQEAAAAAGSSLESEVDYVVVGSGIGGLSAAALLCWYGYNVTVLESHYLPGGVAHTFEKDGFHFDAGPSLWNGMDKKPYNPLREILEIVGEGQSVEYRQYDGWVMHIPEGSFKFQVGVDDASGCDNFEKVVSRFGSPGALTEWRALKKVLEPIQSLSTAVPPLALRCDLGGALTLFPYVGKLLAGAPSVGKVEGSFKDACRGVVTDPFLVNWFEFLSFALSGLPANNTIAAAVAYTMRDLHQKGAALDYPVGGSGAVVAALMRGVTKTGKGSVHLSTHVEEICVEGGRAVGVIVRGKGGGRFVRARRGVISNVDVWNTARLLGSAHDSAATAASPELLPQPSGSFVHLHLGINASGLAADLESHYTVINQWDPIDAEQNHVIISVPSTLDPQLAPPGCHVIHAYAAANEPYFLYEDLTGSPNRAAYEELKKKRCDFLYKAVEKAIPDVRSRVIVGMEGSPLTHERFNRRFRGAFGTRSGPASKSKLPYPNHFGIDGFMHCGDCVSDFMIHTPRFILRIVTHISVLFFIRYSRAWVCRQPRPQEPMRHRPRFPFGSTLRCWINSTPFGGRTNNSRA